MFVCPICLTSYAGFLLAVKDVTDANGGVREVAESAHLNRETLYRTLSENGNPKLTSLDSILHAVGLRLSVKPSVTG